MHTGPLVVVRSKSQRMLTVQQKVTGSSAQPVAQRPSRAFAAILSTSRKQDHALPAALKTVFAGLSHSPALPVEPPSGSGLISRIPACAQDGRRSLPCSRPVETVLRRQGWSRQQGRSQPHVPPHPWASAELPGHLIEVVEQLDSHWIGAQATWPGFSLLDLSEHLGNGGQ